MPVFRVREFAPDTWMAVLARSVPEVTEAQAFAHLLRRKGRVGFGQGDPEVGLEETFRALPSGSPLGSDRASRRFVERFTLREADGGVRTSGSACGATVFSPVEDSSRRVVRRGLRAPCGHGSEGCFGSSLPGRFQGPAGRRPGTFFRTAAASAPHPGKRRRRRLRRAFQAGAAQWTRRRGFGTGGRNPGDAPRRGQTGLRGARLAFGDAVEGKNRTLVKTGTGVVWRLLRRRVRSALPADRNRGKPRTRRLMIPGPPRSGTRAGSRRPGPLPARRSSPKARRGAARSRRAGSRSACRRAAPRPGRPRWPHGALR